MIIKLEYFQKIELRVGKIITAEKIENSQKLLRLEIDLGNEWRQIVSGIADQYNPEKLINKKVVIIANLESKTIKGIESQGMLLAAEDEHGIISLISPDKDIKEGSIIK